MKAMMCRAFGPPESLVLQELPSPPLAPGQLRVAVHACGVNFPDLLMMQGRYQFKPPLPFAPGGEVAGVVVETGPDATGFPVGARVRCSVGHGGFADEVVVAGKQVVALPDAVDFVTGAVMGAAYGTSLHALADRAQLAPGESVLVLGATGGVGLSAVQLAKLMGARVLAAGGSDAKLAQVAAAGADAVVNYNTQDLRAAIAAFTDGKGVDVVYDTVGGSYSELALRSTAWRGRFLVVGFTAGEIPKLPANLLLLKGCAAIGVFYGDYLRREPEHGRAEFQRLMGWFESGQLKPHIHRTYPLAEASAALRAMADRQVVGKIVVVPR
ncbi:NADPH:quinone oxidoreductase family protein [Vineibacter terrae]|uniref:NADPH:quinone oxidoreductase family protein n=1 Tax=Vineibacter terrae TaxID=2586908 RepID=UPI0032C21330